MKKEDFKKLIKSDPPESNVDWAYQRDRWLEHLGDLYSSIESWLHDLIQDGTVVLTRRKIELFEEGIGDYAADIIEMRVGKHKIVFEPVGTMLIGAWGRVNVSSAGWSEALLLVTTDLTSMREMVKVKIHSSGSEGEIDGSIKIGKPSVDSNKELNLVWKILRKDSYSFVPLEEETFFDMIANFLE